MRTVTAGPARKYYCVICKRGRNRNGVCGRIRWNDSSKHEDSPTVKVLEAVFDGRIVPLYHSEILEEYNDVFHREVIQKMH